MQRWTKYRTMIVLWEVLAVMPGLSKADCLRTGDITFDGVVSAGDAQLVRLICFGLYEPDEEELCAGDCNGDGSVTSSDA